MYSKSAVIVALCALSSARLVVAIPPACLLGAVNTQPNPADLSSICGPNADDVMSEIEALCGNEVEAAMDAFEETCGAAGLDTSSIMTSTTSASDSSSTGSSSDDSDMYVVSQTSTYYDSSCSCSKTVAMAGTASGYATKTANGVAKATGVYGNATVPTAPNPTGGVDGAASTATFTGSAARYVAGPFAGVAILAAGFIIAM